ncbi:MAG: hypothetical protein ACE5ER_03815 [Nitrospinaceae bacterium]
MSQLKIDLICEIIRKSQCNFLEKRGFHCNNGSDPNEERLLNWVRHNAREYREHFRSCLEGYSTSDLGEILKTLANSEKDLNDILDKAPLFMEKS